MEKAGFKIYWWMETVETLDFNTGKLNVNKKTSGANVFLIMCASAFAVLFVIPCQSGYWLQLILARLSSLTWNQMFPRISSTSVASSSLTVLWSFMGKGDQTRPSCSCPAETQGESYGMDPGQEKMGQLLWLALRESIAQKNWVLCSRALMVGAWECEVVSPTGMSLHWTDLFVCFMLSNNICLAP